MLRGRKEFAWLLLNKTCSQLQEMLSRSGLDELISDSLSLSLMVDSWYTVMYRQAPRDLEDETWCTTRIATTPLQVSRFRLQCLRCWPTSMILKMSCKSLASFSFNSMHSQMYITWGCLSHMSGKQYNQMQCNQHTIATCKSSEMGRRFSHIFTWCAARTHVSSVSHGQSARQSMRHKKHT